MTVCPFQSRVRYVVLAPSTDTIVAPDALAWGGPVRAAQRGDRPEEGSRYYEGKSRVAGYPHHHKQSSCYLLFEAGAAAQHLLYGTAHFGSIQGLGSQSCHTAAETPRFSPHRHL